MLKLEGCELGVNGRGSSQRTIRDEMDMFVWWNHIEWFLEPQRHYCRLENNESKRNSVQSLFDFSPGKKSKRLIDFGIQLLWTTGFL